MKKQQTRPVPRGRNGGRKPPPPGQERLGLSIRLPAPLVALIRADGPPTQVIKGIVTQHYESITASKPAPGVDH
jgi:hypothetical protein